MEFFIGYTGRVLNDISEEEYSWQVEHLKNQPIVNEPRHEVCDESPTTDQ